MLELHRNVSIAVRVSDGTPQRIVRVYPTEEASLVDDCLQAVKAVAEGEQVRVALNTRIPIDEGLPQTLQEKLDLTVTWIEPATSSAELASLYGAGLHAVGEVPQTSFPSLSTLPPSIPFKDRRFFFEAMGALALFLLIAGLELFFALEFSQLEKDQDIAREKLTTREVAKEVAEEEQAVIESGKTALSTLQDEVTVSKRRLTLLGERVPKRAALLEFLFSALSASVSPGVMIERVDEAQEGQFHIDGWSFSENAAQQFMRELAVSMAAKGLEIQDELVSVRSRADEGFGYGFTFKLHPLPAQAEARP